ncbi:phage holin [Paenibacillus sp. Marseille-Q4541]|uniref:phage holin n=1 Tax=Paenibacillus sp. Marseille-Q4541 TaxID=2831522 RepID=UPI001BA7D503|nr:phage holin [Paenibacillus sp. Marseille-Q4541]
MSKFKTYEFWTIVIPAFLFMIQAVGNVFGLELTSEQYDQLMIAINGVLAFLLAAGVIIKTVKANEAKKSIKDEVNELDK